MSRFIAKVFAGVILAVIACLLTRAFAGGRIDYPAAPRGHVVDRYHGHAVADPYRWLEDSASPQTAAWVQSEASLTSHFLSTVSERKRIHDRLSELSDYARVQVPWREAGRLFWLESRSGQPQDVLCVRDKDGGRPRVFFDPNAISPDGSLAMGDYLVSPDGRWLAYSASPGGADAGAIRVRDIKAGQDADGIAGLNGCWTRDSRGFFYAQSFQTEGSAGSSARAGVRAFYHQLGDPQSADRRLMEWDEKARWVYFMVSEDGHYAAIVAEEGPVSEVYQIDLHAGAKSAPFEVLADSPAFHTPIDWVGDTFYLRTELDAPRQRVIAIDLRGGAKARPRTIVAENADVIVDAVIARDRLVVNYLSDVHSRLRLFDLAGKPQGEIPLPGIGAVGWPLSARPSTPALLFSFQSFLAPASVSSCDVRTLKLTAFQNATVKFDASRYETKQVFFLSKDGTRVPMFITAARHLELDGTHPVFLTGYGGYGATMQPAYSPDVPLWLEMGGIYVLANIRGGGEYGETWHRAGMLEKKQTSFDDFIAAAEYLIHERYTERGRIAVYGHSNGGLLIGAVLTQRPDLFGAAIANAGHYDMLRYHRFTAGAGWVTEYGSADDSTQFDYLRAYSPLQNVKDGACYPATLLLAADHDDRVVPAHAYKFAAALQAAQSCDAPILLRVAANASHSYASRQEMIDEHTDMWSFIATSLRVHP